MIQVRSTHLLLSALSCCLLGAMSDLTSAANGNSIKVAAVQIRGYDKTDLPRDGYDPAAAMVPYVQRAAQAGAELVVFPEYVLGRIEVPSISTQKISKAASEGKVYVVVGCWETFPDGTYANSALIFDRTGKIAAKYRKTHAAVDKFEGQPPWSKPPQHKDIQWFISNDPEWTMQRGQELSVFDFDFGRVGIMTCYDGWFPESARVLSLKGAELVIWMNGRRGSVEDFIVKTVMFQSHVGMICTNQAYGGGTMIGEPTRILKQCAPQTEQMIVGEINLNRIRQMREFSRNFRQRRPDLYGKLTEGAEAIPSVAADSVPQETAVN